MEKYIYDALYYYNEDDEVGYDLFNVQLLENINGERVELLKEILQNEDKYIAYQAMLILLAWNINEGYLTLSNFFSEKWFSGIEFEPHRIFGEDSVLDVIANAIDIGWSKQTDKSKFIEFYKIILSFYGSMYFEGKLKAILLKRQDLSQLLLSDIKIAIKSALKHNRHYQASQFLPVLYGFENAFV